MAYIIILTILILLTLSYDAKYNHKFRKTQNAFGWYVLSFMIFVLMASLRDVSMGADTQNYLRDFNDSPLISSINSEDIEKSSYQPFWNYLVAFIKEFLRDFNWLLCIESLFLNSIVFRFFWKNSDYPFLCVTLYFCMVYIGLNFETIREGIAVAFCLLAYEQLTNKRYINSILLWVCAFLFHISALIALLYPVCMMIHYSKITLNIIFVIACILLLIFPLVSSYTAAIEIILSSYTDNIADRFAYYNNTEYNPTVTINYYISLVFCYIIFPFTTLYIMQNKSNKLFGFIIIYVYFGILVTFSVAFDRFTNYYVFFFILYLSDFCKYLMSKQDKRLRPFGIITIILIVIYINQSTVLRENALLERYHPYKSILNI